MDRILEHLPLAAAILQAPEYRFIFVNARFRQLTQEKGNLLGLQVSQVWPEHESLLLPLLDKVYTLSQEQRHENALYPTAEGLQYWDLTFAPLSVAGEVDRILFIAQETTQINQCLRATEENFQTLANNIPQIAWMNAPQGQIIWLNRRWFEFTGCSVEESYTDGWQKVCHPDHIQRLTEKARNCCASGERLEETVQLRGRDGNYRWFLLRSEPIRNASGIILRWFGTGTDITEIREAGEALQESDRAKTQFLAMLSHELRNPLASIASATHVLEKMPTQVPEVARALQVIQRQTGQLSHLVDQLLDIVEVTFERVQLNKIDLNLTRLVAEFMQDQKGVCERYGLRLQENLPNEPLYVQADPVRIGQVLANLLDNACKFTPPGGEITMTLRREESQALVEVQDTGIGFTPEEIPFLFQAFGQADKSLDRQRGGLGLGLPLARDFVRIHGGEIQAMSPGRGLGACFRINLPLISDPETPPPAVYPVSTPRRILLIEDHPDVAQVLSDFLTLSGHQVVLAQTGMEGLEKAKALNPEICFCDIGLPQMNGYEVAKAFRQDPTLAHVFLVALSGYALPTNVHEAQDAGFDLHLAKPVRMQTLLETIANAPTFPS